MPKRESRFLSSRLGSEIRTITIARLSDHPEHLATAAGWIHRQWDSGSLADVEASLADGEGLPPALIALDGQRPVGIVGFKHYPLASSGGDNSKLWVNALYVEPDCRDSGIGTQLLAAGVEAAEATGRATIYVYTDVPEFYRKRGWVASHQIEGNGMHVLRRRLKSED